VTSIDAEQRVPEQDEVAEFGLDERALVDAPAGTGKTHVLARRLTTLVDRDDLSAGDELLVLSFSRAAVSELRARVGHLGGDARYVGASTFDAFATRLLATEDPDGSWTTAGYDKRIRAAVDLLRGAVVPDLIGLVRHILVDEVQDLVGPRAALVMSLLERHKGGFTLFGDPAQAIYGHQSSPSDGPTNAELYAWLEDRFGSELRRRTFNHDFRGQTRHAAEIVAIGRDLRRSQPDQEAVASSLRSLLLAVPSTTMGAARRLLVRADGTTTAVLCRTNAQALRISKELHDRGIAHRYQRRGEDKAAAGWLSLAVFEVTGRRTTHAALMPYLHAAAEGEDETADELFALIRRLAPTRGDDVDLDVVAGRLRVGSFPEELNCVVREPVVVSTIHRAKGLEFDRVLLCEYDDRPEDDLGAENRLRYVALSRARRDIFHLLAPETAGLRTDQATRRWIRTGFGRERWRVREVEVLGSDSDAIRPAGSWPDDDPRDLQRYLLTTVRPGDPVELGRVDATRGEEHPRYVIWHAGRGIGTTSEHFGADLRRLLGQRAEPPRAVRGLHVEMVDTVAGDPSEASRVGLGAHGMWARVRVFGLGTLVFGDASEE
jgi:hypothetical protein